MKTVKELLPRAALCLLIFTVLCGVLYTGVVTGIGQLIFPQQANGSIIEIDGRKYGCELLGQQYTDDGHMWGRIMTLDTTTFTGQDGQPLLYAWASNQSPASEAYAALIAERVEKLRAAHPEKGDEPIPVDLVTCSGSGLDPHISVAAAEYQVERIARATGRTVEEVRAIVDKYTQGKLFGLFGEATVNVLKVNLALDGVLQ